MNKPQWTVESVRTPLGETGDYEDAESLLCDGKVVATRYDQDDDRFIEIAEAMNLRSGFTPVSFDEQDDEKFVEILNNHPSYQPMTVERWDQVEGYIRLLRELVAQLRKDIKDGKANAEWIGNGNAAELFCNKHGFDGCPTCRKEVSVLKLSAGKVLAALEELDEHMGQCESPVHDRCGLMDNGGTMICPQVGAELFAELEFAFAEIRKGD